MGDESRQTGADHADLRELLLRYLQAPGGSPWPGADGLTVREVLESYSQAAAQGRVPTRHQLVALRPDLAADLNSFFGASPGCQ
jgi:hypothetical protein